jgi:glutathione S-transferase
VPDAGGSDLPVLWHLKVSNYNEKARWALDYKRVPHARRAAVPGRHAVIAKRLTGKPTMPVLLLDGRAIGDSTKIIEALERRQPEPPLYPDAPGPRRDALALEEFFDEQLGPHVRLLVVNHMVPDASLTLGAFFGDLHGARKRAARVAFPLVRWRMKKSLGIDDAAVALAHEKVRLAGERFQSQLGPSGYLVGTDFTVADLTLAALIAPAVAPEQFPYPQPQRDHPRLAPLREALDEWGLLDWAREMYRRHRGESAEVARPRR